MKKKLKVSKKIKYSIIVNGASCKYSSSATCSDPLCYKSPVPIKTGGLYVSKGEN